MSKKEYWKEYKFRDPIYNAHIHFIETDSLELLKEVGIEPEYKRVPHAHTFHIVRDIKGVFTKVM